VKNIFLLDPLEKNLFHAYNTIERYMTLGGRMSGKERDNNKVTRGFYLPGIVSIDPTHRWLRNAARIQVTSTADWQVLKVVTREYNQRVQFL
jgi:hypothetical protein